MANLPPISSDKGVKAALKTDGDRSVTGATGLYLRVRNGSGIWSFRYQLDGVRRKVSLGHYPEVGLAAARDRAAVLRAQIELGQPLTPAPPEAAPTFDTLAGQYIASHAAGWSNAKHRDQWNQSLATYASPILGHLPIAEITTQHILSVLQPIWSTKAETASRVRGRLEAILDYAKAQGLRSGDNPAAWRGHLSILLPKRRRTDTTHHAALPWAQVPAFYRQLVAKPSSSSSALRFIILTACRTSEVLGARWEEIDLPARLWTVPAERMKARVAHRVPLSTAAIALIAGLPRLPAGQAGLPENPYLFPGAKQGKPLSNMAMLQLMRGMGVDAVPHGFRSSFRDWAAETTHFPNTVCEMALAHTISSAVEAAYRRGDLLDRRRELMQAWADYAAPACDTI